MRSWFCSRLHVRPVSHPSSLASRLAYASRRFYVHIYLGHGLLFVRYLWRRINTTMLARVTAKSVHGVSSMGAAESGLPWPSSYVVCDNRFCISRIPGLGSVQSLFRMGSIAHGCG